jgi:hypothetical protein
LDRELTLRDYGRVLWRGRWLILATTIAAALAGLALSFARTTTYTATARVSLGQATTISGIPVGTPATAPATAPDVLGSDALVERVAARTGVDAERIRDGVDFSVPRTPGAQAGNQPAIATIRFTDRDRSVAQEVVNAYAEAVLQTATARVGRLQSVYRRRIAERERELRQLDARAAAAEQGLRRAATDQALAVWQTLLLAAQDRMAQVRLDLANQELALLKSQEIEQPQLVSRSTETTSSGSPAARLRATVFAGVIGVILGVAITFAWRGSPAGRAATA